MAGIVQGKKKERMDTIMGKATEPMEYYYKRIMVFEEKVAGYRWIPVNFFALSDLSAKMSAERQRLAIGNIV